ncbi:hypothetical protein Acsp06_25400 [Actinomycetospora sp. NBRC 106375]|uniref:EthD family reductase n=1 Tax=Actinomycetospora sp. NBRC 106375 TaxID=3032207 RepID=UPI0024A19CAE|nr:EthD family reductase [Actinomycetospora sp. NBRC 106375]GLZ46355.1 hypothetical protein Acsp06_25400 [Actinomycetospora sp. NBRC 106375]
MFKVVGAIKRREGMSFDEFKTWWFDVHVPRVKKWPGLTRYHINIAVSEDEEFDGVAEIWFSSEEAARNVFSTPEGRAARDALADDVARAVVFVAEEHVIVGDGPLTSR